MTMIISKYTLTGLEMKRSSVDIRPWCVRIKDAANHSADLRTFTNNKGKIDLGDSRALAAYNRAIADMLYGLSIHMPPGFLIPTICLRAAYMRLLSQHLHRHDVSLQPHLVEIGTGASAIMAMIAAKQYGYRVTATEINPVSLQSANTNVQNNRLEKQITLVQSFDNNILKGTIDQTQAYDALISYPPVYPQADSTQYDNSYAENEISGRGFHGSIDEMIGGGEDGYAFTQRMLDESQHYSIQVLSALFTKEEHALLAAEQMQDLGRNTKVISLVAGIRTRYITLGWV